MTPSDQGYRPRICVEGGGHIAAMLADRQRKAVNSSKVVAMNGKDCRRTFDRVAMGGVGIGQIISCTNQQLEPLGKHANYSTTPDET